MISQRAGSIRPGSFKTRQNVRCTRTREYQIDLESTLTPLV